MNLPVVTSPWLQVHVDQVPAATELNHALYHVLSTLPILIFIVSAQIHKTRTHVYTHKSDKYVLTSMQVIGNIGASHAS